MNPWNASNSQLNILLLAVNVRAMGGYTVTAGKPFLPEVEFKGKWYPICTRYFAGNNIGIEAVCKALGFTAGTKHSEGWILKTVSMPVGKCDEGDTLDQCKYRKSRQWGVLDCSFCHCKAGDTVGVKMACTGALSPGSCCAYEQSQLSTLKLVVRS